MKIKLTSIPVVDQEKALQFYTQVLQFVKKQDVPLGNARWLTVVSPEEPNGPEIVLEPNAEYPAMKALKESLVRDGIPYTAFNVDNVQKEYNRLRSLGVKFTQPPTSMGPVIQAIFDDTCGNLIQIFEVIPPSRELSKLHKTIDIRAPKLKIWNVLLQDATYREWTAAFYPGSYAETDWKEGSKAYFRGPGGDGMVSKIIKHTPNRIIILETQGIVKNGKEDFDSEEAQKWHGTHETYSLSAHGQLTRLTIDQEIPPDFLDLFSTSWDKALKKVQELAENGNK